MGKERVTQVQEAQGVPGRVNPKKIMSKPIVIKLTKIKDKENILNATRGKQQKTYMEIWLYADFSTETLQARREWHDTFKVMKGKNLQPRIPYSPRLSFILMEKSKAFQTSKS